MAGDKRKYSEFAETLRQYLELANSTQSYFADKIGISPRTVSNWMAGKALPDDIAPILDYFSAALGQPSDSVADRFSNALVSDGLANSPLPSAIALREATNRLQHLQTCFITTPLKGGASLLCLSINVSSSHNQIPADFYLSDDDAFADTPEELYDFLAKGADRTQPSYIADAIDDNSAVVFFGSINSLTTAQIAKLPAVLKSFAALTPRQFRIGLIRTSTTIIVLTVVSAGALLTASLAYKVLFHAAASAITPPSESSQQNLTVHKQHPIRRRLEKR